MVIYNSGDSDLLIQTLSDNLKSSKEIFDKIIQGTQHLNSVIDSGTLSGAAYRAGQSLFRAYISPMIQKLDSAIADIQGDLNSYKSADQIVRAEGSHLDEAQLMQKLDNTNRLIQLVEQKMEEDKKVIQKFMSSGFEGVAQGFAELLSLDGQLNNLKSLKHDYEKKLRALQTFSGSTSSLFTDSLQAFKFALQGVEAINQSKASADGTISFPVGANMSWLKNLQDEKFDSSLSKVKKEIKPENIEVKWTAMNGAGEQYPLIYVNGKLDKEKTSDARWAMTKMGWENFKKMSPEVLAELLCINDFKTLLDPKSSFGENGMSLFSILLTFVPETKAVELVKAMKAAKMLEAGGETLVDLEKISKVAGLTESETKAFSKVISSENLANIGKAKLPSKFVETSARFNESAIGDYAKGMTGNYTQKDINELTKLTTHNAESDTALLGYFEKNSVKSYEQIAYENNLTYFDAGNDGWKSMSDISPSLATDVNDKFLIEQIEQNKNFIISSNPGTAKTIFATTGKGESFVNEIQLLKDKGYKFEKYGDFWKAVKE